VGTAAGRRRRGGDGGERRRFAGISRFRASGHGLASGLVGEVEHSVGSPIRDFGRG
jgi:hypothetical protein